MNQSTKVEKVLDFLAGKGFYIILGICVIAIGASGYILLFGGGSSDPDDALLLAQSSPPPVTQPAATLPPVKSPAPSEPAADVLSPTTVEPATPSPAPTATPAPVTPKPDHTPKPVESSKPSAKPTVDELVFVQPVAGELLQSHSDNELVYNKTMGDWRVHLGMDIAAEAGTMVSAAADGTVKDIIEDVKLGTCVIIDHGNGITSKYGNLGKQVHVIIDQMVKLGDIIGTVGETALWESAEESHLHFEIFENETSVDPMKYMLQ